MLGFETQGMHNRHVLRIGVEQAHRRADRIVQKHAAEAVNVRKPA